jgi:phosphatidate cytidylyltransferase
MLKTRIITALALLVALFCAIFCLSFSWFFFLTTLLTLFAAWEFSSFLKLPFSGGRVLFVIIVACAMLFVWLSAFNLVSLLIILIATFLWWCVAALLIFNYPASSKLWGSSMIAKMLMGIFILVPSWLAINLLREAVNGKLILLFVFIIVCTMDTGAFFAGRAWGRKLLSPNVSPKKTLEGLYGGILLTFLVTFGYSIFLQIPLEQWVAVILLSLITALFAVIGDLVESMLKRQAGVKDSGHYLPGHGGFLDRLDSLFAAAPIFLLGALLFNLLV